MNINRKSVMRKVLAVSLAAAMLVGTGFTAVGSYIGTSGISVSAVTYDTYGDFEYQVRDDNTVVIAGYTGNGGNVTIPSKIDGKSVTYIGRNVFSGCKSLTSVTIPSSVTTIGVDAFSGCTGLTSITIPNSVTSIGYGAFSSCTGLTSVTIPNSVTSIGGYAFSGCTGLTSITIPNGVTLIDYHAFSGCTGLTSVTIPASVTSIDYGVFSDCTNLTSINVSKNNSAYSSQDGVLFNKDKTSLISYPGGKKGSYIIPDGVTSISGAFEHCVGLTSITIPNSVTEISFCEFEYCTGLTSVTIPDSVTEIGERAFSDCCSLENVNIPNSVTCIGKAAFRDCTSLTDITIPDSVTRIELYAFLGCTGLKKITIPNSVTEIEAMIFCGCSSLESVTIPGTVSGIYSCTFEGCSSLKSIVIGDGVKELTGNPFPGCTSLTSIVIPESVTEITYDNVFEDSNVTIYGKKGSYAEKYANQYHIPFVSGYSNISYLSEDEIVLGDTVTVNAESYGGNGDCTYAVLYKKKSDTKWTVKQNYSTNKTIAVKPAKATDYDICVKVKDSAGNIVKKFFDVKVNAKLANTSTISATTIKKGDTVTLKGSATGGLGSYTYAVLYKKKSETKWTVRQGYKANDEILVRPYTNTDYDICIKVQDEQGTIAKKFFSVKVQ